MTGCGREQDGSTRSKEGPRTQDDAPALETDRTVVVLQSSATVAGRRLDPLDVALIEADSAVVAPAEDAVIALITLP